MIILLFAQTIMISLGITFLGQWIQKRGQR